MPNKRNLSFLLVIALLIVSFASNAKTGKRYADSTPAATDAKTIVNNYITAIGGADAIKKITSTSATGNFSVQGMALPVVQKRMTPNKSLQTVSMNGTTVGKTVFNGTKGFQEQMGSHVDMSDEEMTDLKMQTSVIPQTDYVTNPAYKLSVAGTEKVDSADAYKVVVTMPSGAVDTEYYSVATQLLVKQTVTKTVSGQSVTVTYQYSDYRETADVLMPYKQTLTIMAGPINQSIDIILSDIKVNEDVTDADFE